MDKFFSILLRQDFPNFPNVAQVEERCPKDLLYISYIQSFGRRFYPKQPTSSAFNIYEGPFMGSVNCPRTLRMQIGKTEDWTANLLVGENDHSTSQPQPPCKSNDMSWSNITLRYLTVQLGAKLTPSKVTIWPDSVFLRCLGTITTTSVLSEF